jgi:MYXO-CTERM domain-containing protein
VYLFPTDTDGQHASSITPVTGYGSSGPADLAVLNGKVYMTDQSSNRILQLNDDGTLNHVVSTGISFATGLVADPTNGLLYVSTVFGDILAVNPTTGVATPFVGVGADGLTLDVGAQILYAEAGGHILGFRISDGAEVFDSGGIANGPDGTALGSGVLAGNIFVNTNGGTVVEVNLTSKVQTLIASGGSRGDFVTLDPNGSLLLSQTDELLRLAPPSGGCFGSNCNTSNTPEPGSGGLALTGLAGLLFFVRRFAKA